ncbi:MAG TPA: heme exporter protein CcmB [Candidatus Eisenbacteria bacterium]|nr:heme exporter protein CcmB [Candidatus Eisenbacteria bacterium]
MMEILRQACLVLRKDLRLEMRRRESLLTMFFFGVLLLFVFHFSFDLTPENVVALAPALLWLAFLFTGTLGLAQLFQAERENRCLDALLLSPLDPGALFLAKVFFNLVLMVLVELVVLPLFWILFNLRSWSPLPSLLAAVFLGTIGFCVLGTLMSAITSRARARELLLPLLLFPLMVPVILATIRCMEAVFRTGGLDDAAAWLRLLFGFDVIFLTLGILIFDWVIEN